MVGLPGHLRLFLPTAVYTAEWPTDERVLALGVDASIAATFGREYKKNPDAYPDSIREASQLIRVALTGSTRSPDLHAITQALGPAEVLRRVRTLTS